MRPPKENMINRLAASQTILKASLDEDLNQVWENFEKGVHGTREELIDSITHETQACMTKLAQEAEECCSPTLWAKI